jgi:hypothetical protein
VWTQHFSPFTLLLKVIGHLHPGFHDVTVLVAAFDHQVVTLLFMRLNIKEEHIQIHY